MGRTIAFKKLLKHKGRARGHQPVLRVRMQAETIAGNKHIGGTVRVAHGKEAAAHREHAKAH